MIVLRLLPIALASLALCAHFVRWTEPGLAAVCLVFPLLLLFKKQWALRIVIIGLCAGAVIWFLTGSEIVQTRLAEGEPWIRAAAIMAGIGLLTASAILPLRSLRGRAAPGAANASTAAFLLVFILCAVPQARMHHPTPLLLERFLPGFGWVEIFGLATYAAWLVEKLLTVRSTAPIRKAVWLLFSLVFFAQVIAGISGAKTFLMTGELHLPVPAVILAGPIFRGGGFFMTILFLSTIIVAGPIWCSWLCYIGSWDNLAAQVKSKPGILPKHREVIRIGILAAIVIVALGLRIAGASSFVAAAAGAGFGLGGIAVIAVISKKRGIMTHCTLYCPIGLIAVIAGKINPFRMRIEQGCTECRSCQAACRYGALTMENIRARRPGITCTLCGDCTSACPHGMMRFHFPGLTPAWARAVFLTLAVTLHAVFLGFGRI